MKIDIFKYQKIIKEKNKILSDIIGFNNIILNAYDRFKDNFFHIMSIINVGKSIELENKRNSKELDVMIHSLEKSHKIQQQAIKGLHDKFKIDLNGNEQRLLLRRAHLFDEGLKLISKIKFQNLKDMNISANNIDNIEPFNNMNLPFLEFINLSQNNIREIRPLAELNSKKIKEIFLQENSIEDFSPLLKSEFPDLEILRIENNHFNNDLVEFKQLLKKYDKKIIYISKTVEQFNKKYSTCLFEYKKEIIDLGGLMDGNDIIQELYLIINQEVKIKKLNLHYNFITNASLLGRMNLRYLQTLDLSLNKISNLKFITEIKSPHLVHLFLNDNNIKDITPLIKVYDFYIYEKDQQEQENIIKHNFPNLELISLKNNLIKEDDYALVILNERGIDTDIKYH